MPEGTIDPSAASGASALRSPMVHTPQCFREVGALRSLRGAVCVLALSSQGHGALFSALMAGAWESLFSGLMRGVALSLRCFGGQPWARFAFCGAVPYHVLKQNAL